MKTHFPPVRFRDFLNFLNIGQYHDRSPPADGNGQ